MSVRWRALSLALALAAISLGAYRSTAAFAAITTSVSIDSSKVGRTFDGIGAISGGGGNSRLLFDYPEPQRSQILDYLFKPGFGASISLLKVEIGGDTNSTDGAEPSHMHAAGDLNCNRGYEWWLMGEAKARNPKIKLAALSWGVPGWVSGPKHTFWTDDTIDYLVTWLGCAKQHHLAIDYIGGWNEKGFDTGWYEKFHAALAANAPGVKLVGDDGNKGWKVADAMAADPAFASAVDVLGIHYSCGYLGTDKGRSCLDSANARATGKPLWASETGSQDLDSGVFSSVRSFNRGYIDARMTAYLNWPLVAAITPNLRFNTTGLVVAGSPWSGAYSVGRNTWAIAHTAQFAAPGWKYVDSAVGYLGGNRDNGSYVTLMSPDRKDYSTIIETVDATAPQTLSFTVKGGLSAGTVHVWTSKLTTGNPNDMFKRAKDITPTGRTFTLTVNPGTVYSLTTTTGQGKGTVSGPPAHGLALPYADGFDSYAPGTEARYLADMDGSFEVANCGGGRTGRCVRQLTAERPVAWRTGDRDPSALLGDTAWTDYTLTVDVLLEHTGYVELQGRVGTQGHDPSKLNAYLLRVGDTGAWSIIRSDQKPTLTTLASGTVPALGVNTWHTLALGFKGSTIVAMIDGRKVGTATDATYAAGQVGLDTSKWIRAQFDNLSVG
jgi:Glycosyl hydrolase family 59